jgi:hypothetical protein
MRRMRAWVAAPAAALLVGCSSPTPDALAGAAAATAPPTAAADSAAALDALIRYWSALQAGRYDEAAGLYGQDWREHASQFVDPAAADTMSAAGFLQATCGGTFVCNLRVRRVVSATQLDPDSWRLDVELEDPVGTPFQRGPCCGEEGDPQRTFHYTLRRTPEGWATDDLPIYIP